jgi:hypothetical protein
MPGINTDPATADRRKPRREQEQLEASCIFVNS